MAIIERSIFLYANRVIKWLINQNNDFGNIDFSFLEKLNDYIQAPDPETEQDHETSETKLYNIAKMIANNTETPKTFYGNKKEYTCYIMQNLDKLADIIYYVYDDSEGDYV